MLKSLPMMCSDALILKSLPMMCADALILKSRPMIAAGTLLQKSPYSDENPDQQILLTGIFLFSLKYLH